jgi:di/tricarboxylate transporter
MVTLIGTPPNIIIAAIREQELGEPFKMFDFAPVGGVAALAGLLFVSLIGWRLIPHRDAKAKSEGFGDIGQFIAELTVPEGSKYIDQRLQSLYGTAEKNDVAILGLLRDGKKRYGTAATTELKAGDALILEATPEALDEFRTAVQLDFSDTARHDILTTDSDGLTMLECVVSDTARVNGRSAQAVGLAWRQRSVLMGISRQGKRITKQLRKTILRPGDILLILVPQETADDVISWLGCLPLADRGLQVTADHKVWLAIGLFAVAVFAASVGLVYLPIALGFVVIAYVLTGIIPLHQLYSHIEWPVVVLLGSMIPLGAALQSSGGTELIARTLVDLTQGMAPWMILTILMVTTMTLSDVLNNTATTIVAAPISIQMAQSLGVNPDPFLMAVAISASAAFLTPIGHKNNTLILGPGGYSFGDYWRLGLPLEILIVAVSIPAILVFWPL